MAKKPGTSTSTNVNLLFKCPVGKSVPGGPFYPDTEYHDLPSETYEHPLIKALIKKGAIMVLSDVETQTGTILAGNLDDATKRAYEAAKRAEEAADKATAAYLEAEKAIKAVQTALDEGDVVTAEENAEFATAMVSDAVNAANDAKKEADSLKSNVK